MSTIDHQTISERGYVDRYFRGDLPPDEEARFEQHFFACESCQAELEAARGLARGLRHGAADDLARVAAARRMGVFAWLARRGRGVQAAALAALLAAIVVPSALLLGGGASPGAPSGVQPRAAELVLLTGYRGDPEPAASIDAERAAAPLELAVDPGPDQGYDSYRARLLDADGALLFETGGLELNALEVLILDVPAGYFSAGTYRLVVSGVAADGTATELADHRFVVAGD